MVKKIQTTGPLRIKRKNKGGRPNSEAFKIAYYFKNVNKSPLKFRRNFGAIISERFAWKYVNKYFFPSIKGFSEFYGFFKEEFANLNSKNKIVEKSREIKNILSRNFHLIEKIRVLIKKQEKWEDFLMKDILGIKLKSKSHDKNYLCDRLLEIIFDYCKSPRKTIEKKGNCDEDLKETSVSVKKICDCSENTLLTKPKSSRRVKENNRLSNLS